MEEIDKNLWGKKNWSQSENFKIVGKCWILRTFMEVCIFHRRHQFYRKNNGRETWL